MTWIAELTNAVDRTAYWKIQITFTDDADNRTAKRGYRFYGSTIPQLAAFVRKQALEFEISDTIDLIPLIGQSIDVTPPVITPPDPPTQAELDRIAWFDDYRQLQQMLQATTDIPALATAQTNTAIANLRASLEAGWLNSYLDGIR